MLFWQNGLEAMMLPNKWSKILTIDKIMQSVCAFVWVCVRASERARPSVRVCVCVVQFLVLRPKIVIDGAVVQRKVESIDHTPQLINLNAFFSFFSGAHLLVFATEINRSAHFPIPYMRFIERFHPDWISWSIFNVTTFIVSESKISERCKEEKQPRIKNITTTTTTAKAYIVIIIINIFDRKMICFWNFKSTCEKSIT